MSKVNFPLKEGDFRMIFPVRFSFITYACSSSADNPTRCLNIKFVLLLCIKIKVFEYQVCFIALH